MIFINKNILFIHFTCITLLIKIYYLFILHVKIYSTCKNLLIKIYYLFISHLKLYFTIILTK
jgi:hypothetical protein